jgi:hypothetical protein
MLSPFLERADLYYVFVEDYNGRPIDLEFIGIECGYDRIRTFSSPRTITIVGDLEKSVVNEQIE